MHGQALGNILPGAVDDTACRQTFVIFYAADHFEVALRNVLDMVRLAALAGDIAGNLDNIGRLEAFDGIAVRCAQDHRAHAAGGCNLDELERNACVAARVLGIHIKRPRLVAVNTSLIGHVVVLADAIPLLKALETRLKVVLDVDLGQLLGHVAVDIADHLAARLLGVQNVGNRLFTVVEVVQIFIQHTAAVLEQTLLEKAHISLGVSLVIGDQLGHNLLSVHLDALEVGQMIQTVALAVNAGRIHAVQVGKLVQHAARRVADTVGEIISHITQRL